jgi:hypothetical protein
MVTSATNQPFTYHLSIFTPSLKRQAPGNPPFVKPAAPVRAVAEVLGEMR